MDLLERYYGKQTFILYGLFASVPGRSVWIRRIFVLLSFIMLSFGLVFQVLKFVIDGFRLPTIVDIGPVFAAMTGCYIYLLYVTFGSNEDYRRLLTIIWLDLKQERSEAEEAVKQHYATDAKILMNVYLGVLIIVLCGITFTGFIPSLLDLTFPKNESREKELLFNGEIFIDQKKYFYQLYFLETCIAVIIGYLIFISENMGIIIVQHLRSMFAMVGYGLENVTKDHNTEQKVVDSISRRIHVCIEKHQRSLQFASLSSNFYDIPLTFVLIGNVCTITISLVQVMDPELISMKMIFFTGGQFFQFLLNSCFGQVAMDSSLEISQNAYNAEWDTCSPDVRRMLQMIILRSSKPSQIVIRKVCTLSIENFVSVFQTITSFYMVIRNAQ